MLLLCTAFNILQNETALPADGPAHFDNAINLRDLSRIFGAAGFEKFRDSRETAADVFRLRYFTRSFREQRARANLLPFLDNDVRTRRNRVTGEHFLLLAHNHDLRMQIFLVFDNDRAHQAGRFVDVALNGDARNHVAEFNLAAFIGKNRDVIGIPLHEGLALFHVGAIWFGNNRANHHIVAFELASFGIVHADAAVLIQHDPTAVERLHRAQIVELKMAIILRLNDRLLEGLARGSTDVECSHRQLRSGLANRLRRNDTDRFTQLHELARGQIASVAHRANATATFAGQDRTNL